MSRKTKVASFDKILSSLKARSFDVTAVTGVQGDYFVSKYNCGAVVRAAAPDAKSDESPVSIAFVHKPGYVYGGEIATLVDRGFQKFLKTARFEVAATAAALHAVHQFTEEFKLVAGEISLYNESLGTTSDRYMYDRVKGRDKDNAQAPTPWALTGGH